MQRAAIEDFPLPDFPRQCIGLVNKVKGQSLFEVCIPKTSFEAYLASTLTSASSEPPLGAIDFYIVPALILQSNNEKKNSLSGIISPAVTAPDEPLPRAPSLTTCQHSTEWSPCPGIDTEEQTLSSSMKEQQEQVLTFIFELPPKYRNTIWVKRGNYAILQVLM